MIMQWLRASGFGLRALSRPGACSLEPGAHLHCFIYSVQQRHCRETAGRTRFRFASLAEGADKFDVLAIEGGQRIERDFLALAVRHRIAIHLVGVLFADVAVKPAERSLVVE